jgi:hypothetical protein
VKVIQRGHYLTTGFVPFACSLYDLLFGDLEFQAVLACETATSSGHLNSI